MARCRSPRSRTWPYPLYVSDWDSQVIAPVEGLIDRWTQDGNARALGLLLPGWRANGGLTDGWAGALNAVRATAASEALEGDDRAVLRDVAERIQHALDNR